MNVIFRCDASIQIGTGHVMRCLTLADELARRGTVCHFICREHEGNLIEFIAQKGYCVHKLELKRLDNSSRKGKDEPTLFHSEWLGASQEKDAQQVLDIVSSIQPDWLIVDHYAIDSYWEKKLRPYCNNILIIDDLADRKHDCDVLIDQTFGRDEQYYQNLVPSHCSLLCGTTYALLRPEFSKWRQYSLERRKDTDNIVEHVLINLGGVDKDNITTQILKALSYADLPQNCRIIVVMGVTAPWIDAVTQQAAQMPWPTEVKIGVNNMAELMANSDLAIGAAGSTSWERCCLGLPTIMVVLADNQMLAAKMLEDISAAIRLVYNENFSLALTDLINSLFKKLSLIELMSKSARKVTEGLGAKKVLNELNRYEVK